MLQISHPDKVSVLANCFAGLTHLHEIFIVHGDIKPSNILVRLFSCQLKLIYIAPSHTGLCYLSISVFFYLCFKVVEYLDVWLVLKSLVTNIADLSLDQTATNAGIYKIT